MEKLELREDRYIERVSEYGYDCPRQNCPFNNKCICIAKFNCFTNHTFQDMMDTLDNLVREDKEDQAVKCRDTILGVWKDEVE